MTDPNQDPPSDIQPTSVSEIVNENGSETPKADSPELLEKTEDEEQSMETKKNIDITSQILNTTSITEEQIQCPDEIKETLLHSQWADCPLSEEEEEEEKDKINEGDPTNEDDEVLKSHPFYTKGLGMDYEGLYRQIEGLRSQIGDLNTRIVELECSMGRVGVAFSHMSSLHSVYQGKSMTVLGNARGSQNQKDNGSTIGDQGYFGNKRQQQHGQRGGGAPRTGGRQRGNSGRGGYTKYDE